MMEMQHKSAIPAGVFFIGLGLLFWTHSLFPGLLFLIAAVAITHAWVNGYDRHTLRWAAILLGLGAIFMFGFSFPFLLMLFGAWILFMAFARSNRWHGAPHWMHEDWDGVKRKWGENDEDMPKHKNDSMYI
jgi:hypothetical protein